MAVLLCFVAVLSAWFPSSPEPHQSWDQATHLLLASDYHAAWRAEGFPAWRRALRVSSFYPPFYHLCVAALFLVVGVSSRAAGLVGGLMLVVLAAATGGVAHRLSGGAAGWLAAAFVLAAPGFAALAAQPLLDLTLAAWVAVAVWLVSGPGFGRSWRCAILAAVAGACGLLTKWMFPLFVAGPLLVRLARGPRPMLARTAVSAVVAVLLAGVWYVPHAGDVVAQARLSVAAGRFEGDPAGLVPASLAYYPRAILTYFSLPLRVLLLAGGVALGLAWLRRTRPTELPGAALLASWLLVPIAALTLIANKDPRYIAPAAPALAILAAQAVCAVARPRLRAVLLAVVAVHAFAVQVVRWRASDASAAAGSAPLLSDSLRLDLQTLAVPDPRGWPVDDIAAALRAGLTRVSPSARLAVVPDLPYVNAATLRWAARRAGWELQTFHPDRPPTPADFTEWEYALLKPEGDQGAPHATRASAVITADVMARTDLRPVRSFATPSGALLLARTRHSLPPSDLRPRGQYVDLRDPAAFWHLGDGWSFQEPWGRWAAGRRAALRVELPQGMAHRLTVSLCPPESLVGAQLVTVRYGDRRLRSFRLGQPAWAWEEQGMELPAGLASGGIDTLSLSFARVVPAGGVDADRELAAAVRWVRFEPHASR